MTAPLLRGSIHWVELDKRRPAVLLSPDRRNLLASDVVIVPCSTMARPMSWHVELKRGEGGVPTACMAKCEQITTIAKHRVHPKALGSRVSATRMAQIEQAILLALGITA
jgi:mRNA-degrading endonuclease toxin of MazEF toxin-antitoxin module